MNVDGRVEARIDAGAIAHNLACLRRLAGPARIWATAKADAYGHGLALALPGLREADGLAVLHLDAAWAAQAAGWDKPILVYGGLFDAAEAGRLDLPGLHLVISHAGQMDWLAQAARPARPPAVWLRYAGETRLGGFGDADYAAAYARCAALRAAGRIAGIGHLNHYARAEDADGVEAPHARFRSVIEGLPGPISTGNSAALLRHAHHAANTDWVRPGLALYGASPLPGVDGPGLGLRPPMPVSTRL
jgi:alanine racemase